MFIGDMDKVTASAYTACKKDELMEKMVKSGRNARLSDPARTNDSQKCSNRKTRPSRPLCPNGSKVRGAYRGREQKGIGEWSCARVRNDVTCQTLSMVGNRITSSIATSSCQACIGRCHRWVMRRRRYICRRIGILVLFEFYCHCICILRLLSRAVRFPSLWLL